MNILQYTTFDLPVEYKNLKLYPVTMKDYFSFNTFAECLTIDKNSIPDPKVISMTHLEYIYYSTEDEKIKVPYLFLFDRLLSLCLKDDDSFSNMEESIRTKYNYDKDEKPIFIIQGKTYYSEDFDNIKEIISKQNKIEQIDENISKEVRDSLEMAREFKRKISGNKPGSIEDYIISLSVATGWKVEEIYSMPIKRFLKCIERMDNLINYQIYMTASMSGMVEFKDKTAIKHWLSSLEDEDKYSDVSVDLEEVQDKISFESAKK